MPWCEPCGRFYNPNTMNADGTCPEHHAVGTSTKPARVPWHFWVLLAAVALYLGWRVIQGVGWLSGQL